MGRFEKCSEMICMKSQVGFDHFLALLNFVPHPFFRHCSFLYLNHTQIQAQRKIPWDDLKNATKWYAWSVELDFFYIAHFCTWLTLRNYWNESEIISFYPKNHLKVMIILNQKISGHFWPFFNLRLYRLLIFVPHTHSEIIEMSQKWCISPLKTI